MDSESFELIAFTFLRLISCQPHDSKKDLKHFHLITQPGNHMQAFVERELFHKWTKTIFEG